MRQATEARILAKLVRSGMAPDEADELAAARSEKAAPALARRHARKAARARFGRRAASGIVPRLQIKGAAGLGKTQAIIDEYLRRPSLWKRHITVYEPNLQKCYDFAADLARAARGLASAPDGSQPRVIVIRGRTKELCARTKLTEAAAKAGCDSVFRACCHTPAGAGMPESFCPEWDSCKATGYVAQFLDHGPALRVLPHARLSLSQPNDLRLPAPDLVIIDETVVDELAGSTTVDPALLSDFASYASEPGQEHLIQEAAETGAKVAQAMAAAEPVIALRAAGVEPDHLREAAAAATLAARKALPPIHAGMDDNQARERLWRHKKHHGRAVAGVLAQLARDMQAGRRVSIGAEWDAKHTARMEDGTRVPHPIIRSHSAKPTLGAPSNRPLLLLDADADLTINRRLFGANLRGFTVPAMRTAHVIQVSDAALTLGSLAPDADALPKNVAKAAKLRGRIAEMVRRETAGGKRVLLMTAKEVRRALTGETDDALSPWVSWEGAELSHFGRHLGVNRWSDFDTVIVVGRAQLPPDAAERTARAIWANSLEAPLDLSGAYRKERRRHDLRSGAGPAVEVQAHADPRVQAVVEMKRENAMGQSVDRLRLIHRPPNRPARVLVVSNLPIPGLVVDQLVTLDDMLEGGTVWERSLARAGGVLPLSPDWLSKKMADLFGSRATATRTVAAGERCSFGNIGTYCQMSIFRTAGQRCPSKVLIGPDVTDPRAALEQLLGVPVVDFRPMAEPPAGAAQPPAEAPAPAPESNLDEPAQAEAPPPESTPEPSPGDAPEPADEYAPLPAPLRATRAAALPDDPPPRLPCWCSCQTSRRSRNRRRCRRLPRRFLRPNWCPWWCRPMPAAGCGPCRKGWRSPGRRICGATSSTPCASTTGRRGLPEPAPPRPRQRPHDRSNYARACD